MDGKVVPRDGLIARIAERQHGVVSIAQLREAGINDDAVRARTLSGRLHRVHRGVYAVGHSALSPEGRCMAAVLAVGKRSRLGPVLDHWGAAVSHRSAAALWGLLPIAEGSIDVAVRRVGRAKRHGVRIHQSRSLTADQVTLCRGIPVTKPMRTIADLRRAISMGLPGAISKRELRKAIRQANVVGLPVDDDDAADRTRSDLERAFLAICMRHRLPRPEINVRIGSFLVDFLWRDARLVVETDGYRYHRGQVAFQDDRDRDLELMRLGYTVLRLSERQIDGERERVAEVLAAALRDRAA